MAEGDIGISACLIVKRGFTVNLFTHRKRFWRLESDILKLTHTRSF